MRSKKTGVYNCNQTIFKDFLTLKQKKTALTNKHKNDNEYQKNENSLYTKTTTL